MNKFVKKSYCTTESISKSVCTKYKNVRRERKETIVGDRTHSQLRNCGMNRNHYNVYTANHAMAMTAAVTATASMMMMTKKQKKAHTNNNEELPVGLVYIFRCLGITRPLLTMIPSFLLCWHFGTESLLRFAEFFFFQAL